MTSIAQPLTNLSTQCKLPITLPQAMGLMQQAHGAAGGLPTLPGNTIPPPPAATNPLGGPPRGNAVG
jgi:heme-binding protein